MGYHNLRVQVGVRLIALVGGRRLDSLRLARPLLQWRSRDQDNRLDHEAGVSVRVRRASSSMARPTLVPERCQSAGYDQAHLVEGHRVESMSRFASQTWTAQGSLQDESYGPGEVWQKTFP